MGKDFDDLAKIKHYQEKNDDKEEQRIVEANQIEHIGTIKSFSLNIHAMKLSA